MRATVLHVLWEQQCCYESNSAVMRATVWLLERHCYHESNTAKVSPCHASNSSGTQRLPRQSARITVINADYDTVLASQVRTRTDGTDTWSPFWVTCPLETFGFGGGGAHEITALLSSALTGGDWATVAPGRTVTSSTVIGCVSRW